MTVRVDVLKFKFKEEKRVIEVSQSSIWKLKNAIKLFP